MASKAWTRHYVGTALLCALSVGIQNEAFAPKIPIANRSTAEHQLLNESLHSTADGDVAKYVARAEDAAEGRHYIQDHTQGEGGLTDSEASTETRASNVGSILADGDLNASLWEQSTDLQAKMHEKFDTGQGGVAEPRAVTYTGLATDTLDQMLEKLTLANHDCDEELLEAATQDVQADGEGDATAATSIATRLENTGKLLGRDPVPEGNESLWLQSNTLKTAVGSFPPPDPQSDTVSANLGVAIEHIQKTVESGSGILKDSIIEVGTRLYVDPTAGTQASLHYQVALVDQEIGTLNLGNVLNNLWTTRATIQSDAETGGSYLRERIQNVGALISDVDPTEDDQVPPNMNDSLYKQTDIIRQVLQENEDLPVGPPVPADVTIATRATNVGNLLKEDPITGASLWQQAAGIDLRVGDFDPDPVDTGVDGKLRTANTLLYSTADGNIKAGLEAVGGILNAAPTNDMDSLQVQATDITDALGTVAGESGTIDAKVTKAKQVIDNASANVGAAIDAVGEVLKEEPTTAANSLWKQVDELRKWVSFDPGNFSLNTLTDELGKKIRGGETYLSEPSYTEKIIEDTAVIQDRVGDFTSIVSDEGDPERRPTEWAGGASSWPINVYPWPGTAASPAPAQYSPWPFSALASEEDAGSIYVNLSKAIMLIDNKLRFGKVYDPPDTVPTNLKALFDAFAD